MLSPLPVIEEATDIDTTTFTGRVVDAYIDTGRLPSHVESLRRHDSLKHHAMPRALQAHFPAGARWRKPESGLFVWVELPVQPDADEPSRATFESERVAVIHGRAFSFTPDKSTTRSMRLNFSHNTPEQIVEGGPTPARALKGLVSP